jgi:outer membrane protein with beta-barrel domain
MRLRSSALFALALSFASPFISASFAQAPPSWGDFAVSPGVVNYDLSGTGTVPGFAARMTRDFTPHVALEVRGLYARLDQQFGSTSLFIPEAQLQYRWNVGRVAPYVGGGIGLAIDHSRFHTETDPALSVAGGARVKLTERVGVLAEMRLRGIEWGFTGSVAEWSAGLSWRLPSF